LALALKPKFLALALKPKSLPLALQPAVMALALALALYLMALLTPLTKTDVHVTRNLHGIHVRLMLRSCDSLATRFDRLLSFAGVRVIETDSQ